MWECLGEPHLGSYALGLPEAMGHEKQVLRDISINITNIHKTVSILREICSPYEHDEATTMWGLPPIPYIIQLVANCQQHCNPAP